MNDQWKTISVLRQTVYGRVLEMECRSTGRRAIGKLVFYNARPVFQKQLKTEARVLEALHSRWIPELISLEEQEEGLLLIEEKMEGISLEKWMRGKPSSKHRKRIFVQIVELLGQLHAAGYVYLDLKPENILVDNDHACLLDFNACVPAGSRQAFFSNPEAAPPEALAGKPLDFRADLTGLGFLHRRMFGWSWISWTCLQKNPDRRFASLQDLKKACQSQNPMKYGLYAAVSVLCISQICLSAAGTQYAARAAQDDIPDVFETMDAARVCRILSEGDAAHLLADPVLFHTALEAALLENHLPLQRFLYQFLPESQCDLDALQLELQASGSVSLNRLEQYLLEMADEVMPAGQLVSFCSLLMACDVLLPRQTVPSFEKILEECALKNEEQAQVVMELILEHTAAGIQIEAGKSVEQLLKKSKQGIKLWQLYSRSRLKEQAEEGKEVPDQENRNAENL